MESPVAVRTGTSDIGNAVPVVDSSVWLEWFTDGERVDVAERILTAADVRVPVLVYFEVYKEVLRRSGLDVARVVAATMRARAASGIEPLDEATALEAARISVEERPRLAAADALILAYARVASDRLVTLDHHFEGRPGAVWWPKGSHRQRVPDPEWSP